MVDEGGANVDADVGQLADAIGELESSSVRVNCHDTTSIVDCKQYQHPNTDSLRREYTMLLGDFNAMRAKQKVTLLTLASLLHVGPGATWADVVEAAEVVAERAEETSQVADGGRELADTVAVAREDARQADLECERLEDKLESQSGHVNRFRELIQKQQQLLDMSAEQISSLELQTRNQAQELSELRAGEGDLRQNCVAQGERIDALMEEVASVHNELERQCDANRRLEKSLRSRDEAVSRLEAELKTTREALSGSLEECRSGVAKGEQYRAEAAGQRSECERYQQEKNELVEKLLREKEHVEKMRSQLQVFEAAERRRFSYRDRAAPWGGAVSMVQGLPDLSSFGRLHSASAGQLMNLPLPEDGLVEASPRTPSEVSLSSGLLSTRSARGRARPMSHRSSASDLMDNKERDAFLSQFPMASRTERHLRDRLEESRRAHATTADVAEPAY